MKRRALELRLSDARRWLAPALLVVLGLGWAGPSSAASVSSSAGFNAEEHNHHCRCGTSCRGSSCCCGPRGDAPRATAEPPPRRPSPVPARDGAVPCLASAPCGDPGLPTAPQHSGPTGKAATLVLRGHADAPVSGGPLAPPPADDLPPRRPSRIDEPPERDARA